MSRSAQAAKTVRQSRADGQEYDVTRSPSQQRNERRAMPNQLTVRAAPRSAEFTAGASAIFILLLTSIHHAWGAAIYHTPWRLHIVFISVPVAIIIAALLYVSSNDRAWSTVARWAAILVILGFPIAMIGFWEGGFNHLVKNIVFFAHGEAAARTIFPSPMVEMPNDVVFEMTGVMQFGAALYALWTLRLLIWRRR
jgi:hypothetical protein